LFKCSTKYKKVMGIYKITNIINNKFYICSAVNIYDRFLHHRKRLRGNYHNNIYLQRAFNKYGEDNFTFEVIEIVEDKSVLLNREQYWLDYTQCYNEDIGYNLAYNAKSPMLGKKWTEEHKKKFIESRKCMKLSKEHIEALRKANVGKALSKEVKIKISESCKKAWTDDMRENQSRIMKERWKNDKGFIELHKNKEITISEEGRRSISEKKRGSKHHNAKLTEEDVKEIKTMLKNGVSRNDIMKMFNVSYKNLSKIATGKTWSHVKI